MKTILITGASSGIGRATALYFANRGWNVAATMRTPEKAGDSLQNKNIKLFRLDVLDTTSIKDAVAAITAAFGSIDVVVNNAGYGLVGPFEAATEEQIKRQFDTNLFGVMNVIRELLPLFRQKRSGTIINISSMGGQITFPLYSLYHGTKWALEGFSESLHYELRQFNIKVRLVEPGAIKTDFYDRSMDVMRAEGLTAYDDYVNTAFPNMQETGESAPGPEVVAEAVYKAAHSTSGKMRFPVGNNAPALVMLRRLIPNAWFFGMVRSIVERKRK